MKLHHLVLIIIIINISCQPGSSEGPMEIITHSVAAHGGIESWQQLNSLSFRKKILLFDSTGNLESEKVELHRYTFNPEFTGRISWQKGEMAITISFDGKSTQKIVDGDTIRDQEALDQSYNKIMGGFYVMAQPFKLLEEGSNITYSGKDTLENSTLVNVLKVGDKSSEKSDVWWYYFDRESNRLIANLVNHNNHYSYIKNLSFDTTSQFLLHHHRKSYFTDDERKIKYLRAEYFYDAIEVGF